LSLIWFDWRRVYFRWRKEEEEKKVSACEEGEEAGGRGDVLR